MVEAIITSWDESTNTGSATNASGQVFVLHYRDGQSFFIAKDQPIPKLTGRHWQPAGGVLKMPEVGDPVMIEVPQVKTRPLAWGYMRAYTDLAERHYGTSFRANQLL